MFKVSRRTTGILGTTCCFLISITGSSFGQNVAGIQQSGPSVLVAVGSDIVAITPCSANMVQIAYRAGGTIGSPSEIIDPKLNLSAPFSSVGLSSDPAVLSGAQYSVKIYKTPFSLEFDNSTGSVLFKTGPGGMSASALNAAVISGSYYGANNSQFGNLVFSGSWTITAGSQGFGGSPFIWTPAGFGILADAEAGTMSLSGSTFALSRDAGNCKNQNNLFFLIAGTPHQIMGGFYNATAPFPMPPKYAVGFMNSQWGINEAEFKTQVSTYRSKSIPIDLFIFDYDWFTGGTPIGAYCWNAANFPSAPSGGLKQWCDGQGMKMMGIRKPRDGSGNNIDFYDSTNRYNYWHNFIGSSCNPYPLGDIAYWNDEADVYGGPFNFLYMQKSQYVGQRAYNNARVFSLNRNYFGGGHRYAYGLWSGDIYSYWPTMTDMRRHMLASVNLGGAWWSEDIGGFSSTVATQEQYIRWMQMGAFTPIYRVHGNQGVHKQPWYFGAQAEASCRIIMNLRYRLIPYLYTAYHELHQDGVAPVRPFVQDYPSDPNVANYFDAWMFGDAMIAAPEVDEFQTTKSVYLPSDSWYDFWTGTAYTGGTTVSVPAPIDRAPLFVRAGSIIPMAKPKNFTHEKPDDTLEVRIYRGVNGSFNLYEDDDSTYAYETGASSTIPFTWNDASATLTIGARTGSFAGMLNSRVFNVVVVDQRHGIGPDTTPSALIDGSVGYNGSSTSWVYNHFTVSPETLMVSANPGSSGQGTIAVQNQGSTSLSPVTVRCDSSWATASVSGGGNQQSVTISVQPGTRPSTDYTATLHFSASGFSSTTPVVRMRVNGSSVPHSIRIAPADIELATGTTATFSAIVADQFGLPITGRAVSWGVSGGGSVNSSGLFTSNGAAGSFTVSAAVPSTQIIDSASARVGSFTAGLFYRRYHGYFDSPMRLDTAAHAVDSGEIDSLDISRWAKFDSIGVQFLGYLDVTKEDNYTFNTYSSYGDAIFIDDSMILGADNTLPWNPSICIVHLKAAKHKIKVNFNYFLQNGWTPSLSIAWSSPSLGKQQIPAANLTHFNGPYPLPTPARTGAGNPRVAEPCTIRPTAGGLIVRLNGETPYSVRIISMNGSVLRHWTGTKPATFAVSSSVMPMGMYVVQVSIAGQCRVQRIALYR